MNTLEMYKKVSQEDKKNLTIYCIYNSIYTIAKNNNYEITDDVVERIRELSNYVYLKDEYYNFASTKISDFLTECYIEHSVSLEKLENASWSEILEAVDNNNYDFFEEEIER